MDDREIIRLYFERSEQAIRETDRKYRKLLFQLSFHILNNREDTEECISDTYLGAWNAIPPADPSPLSAFLCKIARNISLKLFYRKRAQKRSSVCDIAIEEMEACLFAPDTVEAEIDARELSRIIGSFLDTLPPENRVIFLRRYWFFDSYGEIAGHMGMTEKNISVRLTRIRRKLKNYLEKEGVLL
ncbi:MAG TPA: sigma-70 family RNA polymerase sigma factor [Candidatus Mediterraneibacter cottocaccae]|nr:sigma-70 family RNA polymerase sigma factor [Candidatus Mediterraneibacter cottocaccae]